MIPKRHLICRVGWLTEIQIWYLVLLVPNFFFTNNLLQWLQYWLLISKYFRLKWGSHSAWSSESFLSALNRLNPSDHPKYWALFWVATKIDGLDVISAVCPGLTYAFQKLRFLLTWIYFWFPVTVPCQYDVFT